MKNRSVVYKYKLRQIDFQEIVLREGYQILSVKIQYGEPVLYVLINPDNNRVKTSIMIIGTGIEFEKTGNERYLGTCLLHDDSLVLHFFEIKE